jgi:hypothetical protein
MSFIIPWLQSKKHLATDALSSVACGGLKARYLSEYWFLFEVLLGMNSWQFRTGSV